MDDLLGMKVMQTQQAAAHNLLQLFFSERYPTLDVVAHGTTTAVLHHDLLLTSASIPHPQLLALVVHALVPDDEHGIARLQRLRLLADGRHVHVHGNDLDRDRPAICLSLRNNDASKGTAGNGHHFTQTLLQSVLQ